MSSKRKGQCIARREWRYVVRTPPVSSSPGAMRSGRGSPKRPKHQERQEPRVVVDLTDSPSPQWRAPPQIQPGSPKYSPDMIEKMLKEMDRNADGSARRSADGRKSVAGARDGRSVVGRQAGLGEVAGLISERDGQVFEAFRRDLQSIYGPTTRGLTMLYGQSDARVNDLLRLDSVLGAGANGSVLLGLLTELNRSVEVAIKVDHSGSVYTDLGYEYAILVALGRVHRRVPFFLRPVAFFNCPSITPEQVGDPTLLPSPRNADSGILSGCDVCRVDPRGARVASFLVTEQVKPGLRIWDLLVDHVTSVSDVASVLLMVAYALQVAQDAIGLTHHDLHSSNVLLRQAEGGDAGVRVDGVVIPLASGNLFPVIVDVGRARVNEDAWPVDVANQAYRTARMGDEQDTHTPNAECDYQADFSTLLIYCYCETGRRDLRSALSPILDELSKESLVGPYGIPPDPLSGGKPFAAHGSINSLTRMIGMDRANPSSRLRPWPLAKRHLVAHLDPARVPSVIYDLN